MIQVICNGALTSPVAIPATATIIPFDTVNMNTNSNTALDSNSISISRIGYYGTHCQVVLENAGAAAVTVTLQAYADGTAINGAYSEVTIPAAGYATIDLDWALSVIGATSGTAVLSWYLSGGAVNLYSGIAHAFRYA